MSHLTYTIMVQVGMLTLPEIELRTEKFSNINIDSGETLEILAKKGAGSPSWTRSSIR